MKKLIKDIQAKQGPLGANEKGLAGKRVAVIEATVGDHWSNAPVPAGFSGSGS